MMPLQASTNPARCGCLDHPPSQGRNESKGS
jgi:hypothetical protein